MKPRSMTSVLAVGVAVILAGCATMGGGTPEEIVSARAQAFWDARIKPDPKKAYSFTNPAYRLTVSEAQYLGLFPGTFAVGATVKNVKCEPQRCEVGMNLDVNPPLMSKKLGTITMYSTQTWLLEDGQWWLYMEQ